MTEMKLKIATLKNQLQMNKIKFKKTSAKWTLEDILYSFKGEVSSPMDTEFESWPSLYLLQIHDLSEVTVL